MTARVHAKPQMRTRKTKYTLLFRDWEYISDLPQHHSGAVARVQRRQVHQLQLNVTPPSTANLARRRLRRRPHARAGHRV
eukprot:4627136-Pyramimonas_sp.AAC.1